MSFEYVCFSGGGIRGLMYLGVLSALETHYDFKNKLSNVRGFAGTSVGALVSLALMLELSSHEIKEVLWPIVSSLRNIAPHLDISLLISNYGLDDGTSLKNAIKNILRRGGLSDECTFKDLKRLIKKEFVCCTTNLNTKKVEYLRAETHENLRVSDAIFMSMCVPFLFAPVEYKKSLYVDGALSLNVPECFQSESTMYFMFDTYGRVNAITNWNEYLESVFACGIECQESRVEKLVLSSKHCCVLKMPEILRNDSSLNLNIHQSAIRQYILCGYSAGISYVFPFFTSTIEMVLVFVIHSLRKVLENSLDAN